MSEQRFFTIRYAPADRILHMRLAGFWTKEILADYVARLTTESARLRERGANYDILSDTHDFGVQDKEVSEGFERIAQGGAASHRGRTAIVVGSRINKMQAERTLAAANVRVFLEMHEALKWLTEERAKAERE